MFGWMNLYLMDGKWSSLVRNQLLWLLLAIIAFISIHYLKEGQVSTIGVSGFIASFHALIAVLFIGTGRGGKRWIDLGIVQFQPSEILKPFYAFVIAHFAARWEQKQIPVFFFFLVGAFAFVPFFLVFLEPDLGTSVLYLIGAAALLPGYPRLRWKHLLVMLILLAITIPFLWLGLKPYQRERVSTFLNPLKDPLGKGYQVLQSKVLIGAGGWTGMGWNDQSRRIISFLPGRRNDFFFSVLSGVYGFIVASLIIMLFFILFVRMWRMGIESGEARATYFLLAYSAIFFSQAQMHILVSLGLIPTTGIPLPLMSAGGSHLISEAVGLGFSSWFRTFYEEEKRRRIERGILWKKEMIK